MDDVGRYLLGGGLTILFILLAMLFSSVSAAIGELGEGRLKKLLEEKDSSSKAREILKMRQYKYDFDVFVGSAVCGFIAMACLSFFYSFLGFVCYDVVYRLVALMTNTRADMMQDPTGGLMLLAIVLTAGFVLLVSVVFGLIVPKKAALKNPEKTAFSFVMIFKLVGVLLTPFTFIGFKTARGILRLLKVDPNLQSSNITEEDIRMLVDEGNESGVIEFSEREMINNIFDFDDLEVGDVMTHRTELAAVSKTDSLKSVVATALEEGFSRIPVYNEDIDDIVGILYVKDLLPLLGAKTLPQKTAADYMRPVIYVPESTRCRMLFREFKAKKTHMAVVVDEYGGTAGIVTMEDLLESIVGNIQDEYDEEDEEINRIDENTYILQGSVSAEEVCEMFELPHDGEDGPDTLGGIIANKLGHIPEEDEMPTVTIENVSFTVLKVEERRIISVKAVIIPKEESEDAE